MSSGATVSGAAGRTLTDFEQVLLGASLEWARSAMAALSEAASG